jgi:hypothetical protein
MGPAEMVIFRRKSDLLEKRTIQENGMNCRNDGRCCRCLLWCETDF